MKTHEETQGWANIFLKNTVFNSLFTNIESNKPLMQYFQRSISPPNIQYHNHVFCTTVEDILRIINKSRKEWTFLFTSGICAFS